MQERARYNDFGSFMAKHFPFKVQKISIHAGFTCPNRDGSKGRGGCTYCNNQTFNPAYCHTGESVTSQLERGKAFFGKKYPDMRYLAYFQAYSNTYGELQHLINLYEEALSVDGVVGLVIGTRPDCMPDSLLHYLETLSKRTFLIVEYGIESVYDATLHRIRRGHNYACTVDAIERTAARGIITGGHLILGLPKESREDLLHAASMLSELPLSTLKLHQLQIIKGTQMAREYRDTPSDFHLYTVGEYIDLAIDFVERLRPEIVVERFASQSSKELLIAPDWGLKNFEFTHRLAARMKERDTWQGKFYHRV